jgi:hypothetical protein
MTEDWVLHDAEPIELPTGYEDVPLFIALTCGLNGYVWKIYDAFGSGVNSGTHLYGDLTGQFNDLGSLYTTYRLNRLEVSLHQSSTWASVN